MSNEGRLDCCPCSRRDSRCHCICVASDMDSVGNHDPLCPATTTQGWIGGNCQCVLIHRVREDEKRK